MEAPPQLSPDGAYWWDGKAWQPVAQPLPPPPPASEPSAFAPPPPGVAPPSWLAAGQQMPNLQPQTFAPVEPVAAYAGFTPAWSEPAPSARGFSWPIAFSLSGGLSQLGIAGAIVVILMALNTAIALSEPVGSGRYGVPLLGIAVCIRRALTGRWLAVFLIGFTWLVCVGLIQARGGP